MCTSELLVGAQFFLDRARGAAQAPGQPAWPPLGWPRLNLGRCSAFPDPCRLRRAGDWLTCVANTNVHTYEAAPVFTLVESVVLARMAACVGAAWAHAHDGLFVPGGSIANLYGARLRRCPASACARLPPNH